MDGSKCPLILKCAQLKHAGTSKEEMKDGKQSNLMRTVKSRGAGYLEWITILTAHSFLIWEHKCTIVSQ